MIVKNCPGLVEIAPFGKFNFKVTKTDEFHLNLGKKASTINVLFGRGIIVVFRHSDLDWFEIVYETE